MIRSNAEELIRTTMAKFVDEEVIPVARELDEKGEFPKELFKKLADMGVLGIRYPKKVGGSGGNTTLYCIAMEELARGLLSLAGRTALSAPPDAPPVSSLPRLPHGFRLFPPS